MLRRPFRVNVRLNQAEFDRLHLLTNQTGMSREAVMRYLILNRKLSIPKPVDYYRVANEVNRIGVNINQIAHIANAERHILPENIERCSQLLQGLVELVENRF